MNSLKSSFVADLSALTYGQFQEISDVGAAVAEYQIIDLAIVYVESWAAQNLGTMPPEGPERYLATCHTLRDISNVMICGVDIPEWSGVSALQCRARGLVQQHAVSALASGDAEIAKLIGRQQRLIQLGRAKIQPILAHLCQLRVMVQELFSLGLEAAAYTLQYKAWAYMDTRLFAIRKSLIIKTEGCLAGVLSLKASLESLEAELDNFEVAHGTRLEELVEYGYGYSRREIPVRSGDVLYLDAEPLIANAKSWRLSGDRLNLPALQEPRIGVKVRATHGELTSGFGKNLILFEFARTKVMRKLGVDIEFRTRVIEDAVRRFEVLDRLPRQILCVMS